MSWSPALVLLAGCAVPVLLLLAMICVYASILDGLREVRNFGLTGISCSDQVIWARDSAQPVVAILSGGAQPPQSDCHLM